jgi:hypothetical protein
MSVTNLIDQPVDQYDENEPLGLSRYATALTDFIISCETPITVGLQGDWGVGKTSLLNMVKDELGPKRGRQATYPTIYFNTWQYAQLDQEDHLTVAMLHDIVQRIEDLASAPESAKDKASDMLKSVGSMAANLGNQVVKNQVGLDAKQAYEESQTNGEPTTPSFLRVMNLMVEYKQQFRELVEAFMEDKAEGSRLVIMIDDLDRIRPARALDLLSSVKNFLDVPHCVFVLAVDYEVIQRGVAEKLGSDEQKQHGKSYFDKIIQVPFNMPVSSYQVDRYTMSLLGWEWDGDDEKYRADRSSHDNELYIKGHITISEDEAKEIENLVRSTVGQNPRSIKRAVNYYGLLKRVFSENGGTEKASRRSLPTGREWRSVYLELLFGFSCFQLSYPELFDYFLNDPTPQRLQQLQDLDHLSNLNAVDEIAQRVGDIDDVKADITSFFDQLVLILDASDEWHVTAEEFQPVWDVIQYTNLAGAASGPTGDMWDQIREMVMEFAEDAGTSEDAIEEMTDAIELMENSEWGNPLRVKAKDGGIHFFNLFWGGDLVGSITSTKGDPLRFYVEPGSMEQVQTSLNGHSEEYLEEVGKSHYGEGTVRVHLRDLLDLDRKQSLGFLKELNKAVAR